MMKTEKISWKSDGLTIAGEVYIPPTPRRGLPGLILCHGIPAQTKGPDDRGYPLLAERFCRAGFFVLIFNFRGAGLSEGNFDILGWGRDLEAGFLYLGQRPEVDPRRVFLMGFSGGGAAAIYAAAKHPEITGLVSCASPAEFKDILTRKGLEDFLSHARKVGIVRDPGFPSSLEEWRKSFAVIRPLDWIGRVPPRPILILHGTKDDVVPVDHAHRLYARVEGKADLALVEGAGHRLRVEEKAMEKAEEWLKKVSDQ